MTSPLTMHQMIEAKGVLPRRFSPPGKAASDAGRAKSLASRRIRSDQYHRQIEQLARDGAGAVEIADRLHRTRMAICKAASKFNIKLTRSPRPYTAPAGRAASPKGPKMNQSAARTSAPPPSADTIRATMRQQGKANELIVSHCDEKAGRWAAGWDDGRVSAECGVSENWVAQWRIANFGELKANPEIEKLRADIQALNKLVADELPRLEARLRKMETGK